MASGLNSIAQATLEHLFWFREERIDLWPLNVSREGILAAESSIIEPLSVVEPEVTIASLREALGDCQRCKLAPTRSNIVYGVGDERAELMFVGEGPGADEDFQGEPFVGKAGQLLTKMIDAMGLSRERVYIANIIKCRPPRNRNPEADEIEACRPFLEQQIACIKPKVICTLGAFAAQTLLKTTTRISALRGRFQEHNGIKILPTFHPAYLLRNPGEKKKVWLDLQLIMAELNLRLPERKN